MQFPLVKTIAFPLFLLISMAANGQTLCQGQIEAIQNRAGATLPPGWETDSYLNRIGSIVLVRTSFSNNAFIPLCSLSTSIDTDENAPVDVSRLEEVFGLPAPESIIDAESSIHITPALCEHWQSSAQLAMVMEYNVQLEYSEEKLADCEQLNAADDVFPTRLSIER